MKFFKKDEIKHLKLFYLHSGVEAAFAVVWIYWIIYLLDQGFSYSVIGLALAVNGLSMAVLEVPTGALADAVSRKFSVLSGLIGFALILLIIPSIENSIILTLVFALWGLPITLISGAAEAWVVDNLKYEGREDLVKEYYVKEPSIRSFGFIIASLISSVIVRFLGMDALWYVYGVALLASVVILIMQKEHFEKKTTSFRKNFVGTYANIREGAKFTMKEKNILYFMTAAFFITVGAEIALICSKPFLDVLTVPREYFGYLSAIGAALCVGTPFLAKHLAGFFKKEKYYLSLHSFVFGLVLMSVLFITTPTMAAILFVIITLRYTTSGPVLEPFFQSYLPGKLRATVGSFRNMVMCIAILLADSTISLFADSAGPRVMLAAGGLIILPSILFYMKIKDTPSHAENDTELENVTDK